MQNIIERLKKIKLVCTDVDGVLTNGTINYYNDYNHTSSKSFNVRDGASINWLHQAGIHVAFITGLSSIATKQRANDLNVKNYIATSNKKAAAEELLKKYNLQYQEATYIGDDLIDIPLLKLAGLACCPKDATEEVKKVSHWILPINGGTGVLRMVAEAILKHQNHWQNIITNRYTL